MDFFNDSKGNPSMTRLLFGIWGLGVFVIWSAVSVIEMALQPIDLSVVGILFTFMTGKVWQKYKE